jgi:hypothetical protein
LSTSAKLLGKVLGTGALATKFFEWNLHLKANVITAILAASATRDAMFALMDADAGRLNAVYRVLTPAGRVAYRGAKDSARDLKVTTHAKKAELMLLPLA